MTRQLTKSWDFRQNYLCYFHLCYPSDVWGIQLHKEHFLENTYCQQQGCYFPVPDYRDEWRITSSFFISCRSQSTYFTVRGQSYFSRLILTPHPPLRPASLSSPRNKGGGTHSPGGEGEGGSIFWKTIEIGLPSYSKICTLWCRSLKEKSIIYMNF